MIIIKGFLLDNNGDVVIKDNKISMTEGTDLTAQTVRTVLGTNNGEWFGNSDEGISFRNILGKNRSAVRTSNTTSVGTSSQSDGMTEAEEFALAARLRKRLDGDM